MFGGAGDDRRDGLPEGHRGRRPRGGADYLLAVKENQPHLYEDVAGLMRQALDADFAGLSYDYAEESGRGHGRQEGRCCWVFEDLGGVRAGSRGPTCGASWWW